MVMVSYDHEFRYIRVQGDPFPILQLRMTNSRREKSVDIEAYIDSGAQYSLFDGRFGKIVGFNLLKGPIRKYSFVTGMGIEGRRHQVRLSHPDLGDLELEVGFSTSEQINRNILGRDFFNLIQIGFREQYLSFYVTSAP